MITFRFRPVKVIEAVSWMLRTAKSDPTDPAEQLDLHTILKTCYFADKRALNEIGRPVFGAKYIAMRYGPVPV